MAKKQARILYQVLIAGLAYACNDVIEADEALIKKLEKEGRADSKAAAVKYCVDTLGAEVKDHDALLLAAMQPEDRAAMIADVISAMDPAAADNWTDDGKPHVKVIEKLLGFAVTAGERDAVWAELAPSDDQAGIVE